MGKKGIYIALAIVIVVLVFGAILALNNTNQRLGQDAYNSARSSVLNGSGSSSR